MMATVGMEHKYLCSRLLIVWDGSKESWRESWISMSRVAPSATRKRQFCERVTMASRHVREQQAQGDVPAGPSPAQDPQGRSKCDISSLGTDLACGAGWPLFPCLLHGSLQLYTCTHWGYHWHLDLLLGFGYMFLSETEKKNKRSKAAGFWVKYRNFFSPSRIQIAIFSHVSWTIYFSLYFYLVFILHYKLSLWWWKKKYVDMHDILVNIYI